VKRLVFIASPFFDRLQDTISIKEANTKSNGTHSLFRLRKTPGEIAAGAQPNASRSSIRI
jgi:hypothetical protein